MIFTVNKDAYHQKGSRRRLINIMNSTMERAFPPKDAENTRLAIEELRRFKVCI